MPDEGGVISRSTVMLRVLVSLTLLVAFNSVAVAETKSGWIDTTTVSGLFEVDENRMLVNFTEYSLDECGTSGPVPEMGQVIFDPTEQKAKLSLLLTAFASGSKVRAHVGDVCTAVWAGTSYGRLDHVQLIK